MLIYLFALPLPLVLIAWSVAEPLMRRRRKATEIKRLLQRILAEV